MNRSRRAALDNAFAVKCHFGKKFIGPLQHENGRIFRQRELAARISAFKLCLAMRASHFLSKKHNPDLELTSASGTRLREISTNRHDCTSIKNGCRDGSISRAVYSFRDVEFNR